MWAWDNAWFYDAPNAAAPHARVWAWPDQERSAHPDAVLLMRVIAEHGEFVEVAPADDAGAKAACVPQRLDSFDSWQVSLFVRRADLAPALQRDWRAIHLDGTELALRAGSPLAPRGDGYRVVLPGVALGRVPLPAEVVGLFFSHTGKLF